MRTEAEVDDALDRAVKLLAAQKAGTNGSVVASTVVVVLSWAMGLPARDLTLGLKDQDKMDEGW